jgi:N-acetylglucosamine-6-phosphate deacetylase
VTPSTLIHSARVVSDQRCRDDGWVLLEGATIAATGRGRPELRGMRSPDDVVDARGRWLTPGFVDLHCHGAGGATFDQGPAQVAHALAVHRAHGTTRSLLSLVTGTIDDLERQLDTAAGISESDPLVLGVHLEGPFLAAGHKGAHPADLLTAPEPGAVTRLLDAGRGSIRQVTLAPELPGGMAALQRFLEADVAVAVGHTDVDHAGALAAFDAGASILTHAFNGMSGLHHRAPGPVLAAIRSAGVTLEVINDGVHLHPEIVRLAFDEAPGRIALITDAMAATGAPDGEYTVGLQRVVVRDRQAWLADGSSIAGSTLTLDEALRRAVTTVGVPIEVAVAALTEVPARAIGFGGTLGRLAPGFAADAVLLDDALQVDAVWAAGQRLGAPPAAVG